MKNVLTVLILSFLIAGCDKGVDREALKEEVMAVHDAVMPQWAGIGKLKKEVLAEAAALEAADSTGTRITELRDIATALEEAYEVMSVWMQDWSKNAKPYETGGSAGEEETIAFYKAEQERVDKMEKQIVDAVKAAEAALK